MKGHNCENSKCTAANDEIGKTYSYGNHRVCTTCYVPAYYLSELNLSEMWNREWPAKWTWCWQVKIDSSLRKPAAVFRSNFDFFLSDFFTNQTQNMRVVESFPEVNPYRAFGPFYFSIVGGKGVV